MSVFIEQQNYFKLTECNENNKIKEKQFSEAHTHTHKSVLWQL